MSGAFRLPRGACAVGLLAVGLFFALLSARAGDAAADPGSPASVPAAAPPGCPFTVPDCFNRVPDDTCDPEVDPNCLPPPPPPPPPDDPNVPPIPVPCTSPSDPVCHIWPQPIPQTEGCVMSRVNPAYACTPVHVGVTGQQVGPASTPTVDIYEPIP
jgi:hypothetical protein